MKNNGNLKNGNLRNRVDLRLANSTKDYLKLVSRPIFVPQKKFDNNLEAVYKIKNLLTLSKPGYAEKSILELNVNFMYEFHYDYIKKDNKVKLLFTETDSLMYETETGNVYDDKEMPGFVNYSGKSKYYYNSDNLIIGKMKD